MDGWMDEPFSQLFLHRQKAQSKEKRSLEDEHNISSWHFTLVDWWMDGIQAPSTTLFIIHKMGALF
jgi:hypothetical protein